MQQSKIPNFRYVIFSMIVLLALINYIDRGAIAYAAEHITDEYSLDKVKWGAVLGYFGYGYMFGALVGGLLADRFGAKRVWLVAGIAWSIFEILTAYAGDIGLSLLGGSALTGFATIRIFFGFSEGPAYSVINKSVANWATPKERGFVVGFGLLSTPLGALLTAPIAVGLLTLTGSWRVMFIVLGLSGLVVLTIFMCFFTDKPEQNKKITKQEQDFIVANRPVTKIQADGQEERLPWWSFFLSKTLVCNAIGYFAFQYVNFLLLTWTPKYLQDQFHYSIGSLWYMGMIPWIGACFTVVLGGRFSDWLLKKTGSLKIARSVFASVCLLFTTLCFLTISQAQTVFAVIALMSLANALNSLVNSVYWAVIIDTSPANRTGTFSGMTHFFVNIASIVAPTLTGVLTASYGYSSMFVAAAVVTAIGMIAMSFVRPGVGPVTKKSKG